MWRLIKVLVLVAALLLGVAFTLLNEQVVTVNYFQATTDVPLPYVICTAVLVGWLLGLFSMSGPVWRNARKSRKLKRELSSVESEVKNLRKLPIKDAY